MSHAGRPYTGAEKTATVLDHPSLPPVLRHGQLCTWRDMAIKVAAALIQSTRREVVKRSGNRP